MWIRDLSKQAFADTLEQMLITTPIDKIRVTTLAKKVGTSPQTFYYHFKDKYDLIAWIFLEDFSKVQQQRQGNYSADELLKMITTMDQRKNFYKKAFTDKSQNSIEDYIGQMNLDWAVKAVKFKFHRNMTPQEYTQFIYHNGGVISLFKNWLFDRLPIDINQLAQFDYEHTPVFLKQAFSVYPYSSIHDKKV